MPAVKFKITGPTKLGGKRPGEEFTLACDVDGVPLDRYWRRRWSDERVHGGGHLTVVGDQPAPAAPAPVVEAAAVNEAPPSDPAEPTADSTDPRPAPARKKG